MQTPKSAEPACTSWKTSSIEASESARTEGERAEREADLEGAARLRFGTIPELEKTIDQATSELATLQAQGSYLKEEVDAEDIADVVSRWTGVPVEKMLTTGRPRSSRLPGSSAKRIGLGAESSETSTAQQSHSSRLSLGKRGSSNAAARASSFSTAPYSFNVEPQPALLTTT